MALDTEDIKLITGLQKDMEDRIVEAIKGQGTGMRAKIESEVNRIDEMDKLRNGKIRCNEEELEIVKDETKIARWVQRNRRLSAIILMIAMFTAAWGYHTINFKRTVEKVLKIELKDDHNGD